MHTRRAAALLGVVLGLFALSLLSSASLVSHGGSNPSLRPPEPALRPPAGDDTRPAAAATAPSSAVLQAAKRGLPSRPQHRAAADARSHPSSARRGMMDLEAGVRLGSLCGEERCPTADDVADELDAAAAADDEAPAAAPLCLFTSLTEAYVEGHLVFLRSAAQHTPALRPDARSAVPMYVLDQGPLSAGARARVSAAYAATRWIVPRAAKDASTVTKFALNKEKTQLFGLRSACGSVLKVDSGDMLVTADLTPLLEMQPGRHAWACQALGQPEGKINGGLMLFGRYWLHNATERALEARAALESREQSLFGGFFGGDRYLRLLPKRFNVEQTFWASSQAGWRAQQREVHGEGAAPELSSVAVVHYVGRDKPWMRYDVQTPNTADTAADLCRKLRDNVPETCRSYLAVQALWWKAFGAGRCVVVGASATGRGQGFLVDAFERVARVRSPAARSRAAAAADVGTPSPRDLTCDDAPGCVREARRAGYAADDAVLTLGAEPALAPPVRTLLGDVLLPKLGIFGGPAAGRRQQRQQRRPQRQGQRPGI